MLLSFRDRTPKRTDHEAIKLLLLHHRILTLIPLSGVSTTFSSLSNIHRVYFGFLSHSYLVAINFFFFFSLLLLTEFFGTLM
jgi:hypothetical protein